MEQIIDTIINGPARYTQEHNLGPELTLVIIIGALLLEFGIISSLPDIQIIPIRTHVFICIIAPDWRW
jgi:hypothetical protein